MARSGMSNLLTRTRRMVDDTGTAVWTDDQLQDILDEHRLFVHREPLERIKRLTSGTSHVYTTFRSRYDNFEEVTSGTAVFQVEDSAGSQKGTANWSANYINGVVEFTADQEGTSIYLTGYSYDLAGAAAQAWRERMAKVSSYYDFQADGHRLSRTQWFDHCQRMAAYYDQQARPITVRSWQIASADQY